MLRFVRMMRLARLLRLLKLFKELWLMVSGLLQSLKTLGWICLVALLFCYACVGGSSLEAQGMLRVARRDACVWRVAALPLQGNHYNHRYRAQR